MDEAILKVDKLSIGYDHEALIRDISFQISRGKILSLIGANGSGKTTLLKTLARFLEPICGVVGLSGRSLNQWGNKELAKLVSVVMTEKISGDDLSAYDLVASGRYPHSGFMGFLTEEDDEAIHRAMEMTHCLELHQHKIGQLSDGQRQRVLLARALAQGADVILMDEPASFLDIRYQLELLELLLKLSREHKKAIILSLHELSTVQKISDYVLALKGDQVAYYGPPHELFQSAVIEDLFSLKQGSFNPLFGNLELPAVKGKADLFVFGGNGTAIPYYRVLSRKRIPFATGVLHENDVDYQIARSLGAKLIAEEAFQDISDPRFEEAKKCIATCRYFINAYEISSKPAEALYGRINQRNRALADFAEAQGLLELRSLEEAEGLPLFR